MSVTYVPSSIQGTVTANIGLVALPTGASTSALQTSGNASLAALANCVSGNVLSIAGSLTANIGQTNGLALDASISALNASILTLIGKHVASTAVTSVSPVITTSSVKIIDANPNRKGLILYNNSANSVYIAFSSPASSSVNMVMLIATFAAWAMPFPIYTGAIYGIRNAGTGTVLATELT